MAVDVVFDGQEAVERCSRHAYTLIFMDCHMPNMDGFEATDADSMVSGKSDNRCRPWVG